MIDQSRRRWLLGLCAGLVVAAAVVIVVLAMKNRSVTEAKEELAYWVETECRSFASDLRTRAADYAKGLKILNQPEVTDQQRALVVQTHFTSTMTGDMTQWSRRVAGTALWRRFYFCLSVRDGAEKKLGDLSDRFELAREDLYRNDDHATIANALAQMADLATTVRDLPLREHRRPSPLD